MFYFIYILNSFNGKWSNMKVSLCPGFTFRRVATGTSLKGKDVSFPEQVVHP